PRHLHLSSSGSRPSPWGSTGALGPRSQRLSGTHHGYSSWSHDTKAPLSLAGFKSQAEMEARIKEFDEQPLGEHIRPHLLRASTLVVLFQSWFGVAAEEASKASSVAAHVREVKKNALSLMAFLINLADDNGNTVLHYSVSHCNYSIVSVLLDTGVADVNLQNNAGYTSMMLASLTAPDGPSGMEVVRRLMELGNANIKSSQTGQTALHLAVRHGRVVMVRLLLSCGADANIQDKEGTTALMFASERGHTHIARLLLERSQCDLSLADKHGRTALSIATQGSHTDTAALLKAHAKARAL
uniref:Uncharacterized protein n=1 Tax=Periophthalmus magnuspinnatus TaxID=409849 RepID=A0A3B4A1J4_9GOBI